MKRLKKVLVYVLTLSLLLGLVNAPIFSKAETGYTDVTLVSTSGWDTYYDGDNSRWVLHLNTSGYTSTDWSYKYKGFTIEYNGVVGTTDQVSSVDGNRLYCTIPASLVPAKDGVVFTIKAGQYAPDDAGTTTGINITQDFTVVTVDGRLVHTTFIDEYNVEPHDYSADHFYFSTSDLKWNKIGTGFHSWNNFLSPAYCDGTRIDTAGWTSTYSGVFIDGQPMDYWGAHFKNTDPGTFYIDGLNAVAGTTVTVKGLFASSTQAKWELVGHFFIKELNFKYDGSVWSVSRPVEYKTVDLAKLHSDTAVVGEDWQIHINTDNYASNSWDRKYVAFNYECNGVTGTATEVSEAGADRLWCKLPTSAISSDNGTILTIKAGDYAPLTANTRYGIRIAEDYDIVLVDNGMIHTTILKPAAVEAFNHSASSFYFSLKDANGNKIATGIESWTNFLSPGYVNETRIDADGWASTYSGVFINDEPVVYAGWSGGTVTLKNTGTGEFYIEGLNAVAGTKVTVKGLFISSMQDGWKEVGSMFLPELTFTYSGSEWIVGDVVITDTEYTGTPEFWQPGAGAAGFYFYGNEVAQDGASIFPYDAADWTVIATAEDDANSGVFLNEQKTSVYLKKITEDGWYVCMSDASVVPVAGDIITVKGTFVHGTHRITFQEANFVYDGSAYKAYVENPTGTPKLAETEKYGSGAGFYFTSEDGASYDGGWGLTATALDGEDNGVFVNGEKSAINLKKVNTNLWHVCINDAGVTLNYGDVITIKGQFQNGEGSSEIVTFNEASFEFNGRRFGEGTFTATDITVTGLAYSDIAYDAANNRWNMYFTLSTNIPGDIDATYFPYMAYEIDGTEYLTHWFKSGSAKTVNDEIIYNLYFSIESDKLAQVIDGEHVITLKAGASQGRVTGTNVARTDGIRLTEDYSFVVGGDYEASAPAIDYTMANGGTENGIYLSSGDDFPTIGWDYNITKVGENDGIFVNGGATDVYIKKYADNQYYVCLSDLGITAEEGTIVMLKGEFTTKGLNHVTFKTAKYIYTGGQWKVYTVTETVESTGTWGDATAEEGLNSKDLVRVKLFLANEADKIGLYDADLNASGNIDTYDAYMIRRLLVDDDYFRNGYNVDGVPTYTNTEDEMRLAAYVAPEYNASTIATALADYAAAGFTTVIGENRVMYDDANLDAYMQAAKTAGLDVLVQDGYIQTMAEGTTTFNATEIAKHYNELCKYDNFRGLFLGDEPEISQLGSYTNVMTTLNSLNAELGKDMFIANHPLYTDESYLSSDSSLSLSEKYTNYANAYGSLFGEFMYDFYPFRYSTSWDWSTWQRKGNYIREEWFGNLALAATTSKGKVPAGITVQSYAENLSSSDHYRSVTEADISFQIYSALAYGMKSISYFTYDEHWDSNVGTTDCMIYNGQKTGIYTAVKSVNTEIKKIDHMMLNFNWQGTIGFSGDNSDKVMNHVTDYTSPRIDMDTAKTYASNDAIIGCLKDLNGYDGFMLVNATDPSDNKSATVNVTFKDADHAKVYIDGEESIVTLTDGVYNVTLAPGQGIFVIPYIAE